MASLNRDTMAITTMTRGRWRGRYGYRGTASGLVIRRNRLYVAIGQLELIAKLIDLYGPRVSRLSIYLYGGLPMLYMGMGMGSTIVQPQRATPTPFPTIIRVSRADHSLGSLPPYSCDEVELYLVDLSPPLQFYGFIIMGGPLFYCLLF
jgi:hypothetical protein